MKVRILSTIIHDGRELSIGDEVDFKNEDVCKEWIAAGAAEEIKEGKKVNLDEVEEAEVEQEEVTERPADGDTKVKWLAYAAHVGATVDDKMTKQQIRDTIDAHLQSQEEGEDGEPEGGAEGEGEPEGEPEGDDVDGEPAE